MLENLESFWLENAELAYPWRLVNYTLAVIVRKLFVSRAFSKLSRIHTDFSLASFKIFFLENCKTYERRCAD